VCFTNYATSGLIPNYLLPFSHTLQVVFFYQLDPAGEAKGLLEPPFEAFGHLVKPQDAGLKEPFVEGHPEFQFFKVVLLANIEEIFRSVAINLFEQNFDVIKRYLSCFVLIANIIDHNNRVGKTIFNKSVS